MFYEQKPPDELLQILNGFYDSMGAKFGEPPSEKQLLVFIEDILGKKLQEAINETFQQMSVPNLLAIAMHLSGKERFNAEIAELNDVWPEVVQPENVVGDPFEATMPRLSGTEITSQSGKKSKRRKAQPKVE